MSDSSLRGKVAITGIGLSLCALCLRTGRRG